MNRTLRIVLVSGAVLAGGIAAYRGFFAEKKPEIETVAVRRGPIVEEVTETGTVVATSETDLFFRNPGRVVRVLVAEGQEVKKGDMLMALDVSTLSIRRKEAVAALASAQAKYAQALLGATQEDLRVLESTVRNAETSLASAAAASADTAATNESSLSKAYADLLGSAETLALKSTSAVQSLTNDMYDAVGIMKTDFSPTDTALAQQASAAFKEAKAALAAMAIELSAMRASADRADIDRLAASLLAGATEVREAAQLANAVIQSAIPAGSTTQTALDTKKANVKAAWSDISAAYNATDAQIRAVASAQSANAAALNAAEAKETAAAGALTQARQELEARRAPLRDADKRVFETAISSAQASLELIDQDLADATLSAPEDGIIGTVDLGVGELAGASIRAASMISSGFRIEAEVSELDIADIRPGQPVAAVFDALPDRIFAGRVQSVAPRETSKDDDIYYKVHVALEGDPAGIRVGMTADLDIRVGEKSDVLLVPRRQIYRREGKDYVKLLGPDGEVREAEVSVGLRGRDDNEIISGVNEGDAIVVE